MSNFSSSNGEYIFEGVRLLRAESGPCLVCGHPTSDCVGDTKPTKRVIGLGTIPSMRKTQTVYIEEDVIENFEIANNVWTKIVRARAGTHIPVDLAVELGIIEEPRDAK